MTEVRSELMQFKVTPEERRLIEKCAKKQGATVSDYIRSCMLMEMILDGEVGAMKIVAASVGRATIQAMMKRAEHLKGLVDRPETGKAK